MMSLSTMRLPSLLSRSSLQLKPIRQFSSTIRLDAEHNYKLVVVGGGAGGCGTANKFVNKFGPGEVAVIEPNTMHYYQPMWTLVGGGLKTLAQSGRPMDSLLPKAASWLRDSVTGFEPENNRLVTESGDVVNYEFLVVAMGLQLRYDKIKGLPEAFDTPGVGSNYSVKYVEKTQKAIQEFKGGNALFTYPNSPIKCPGAPQKIMYLAEETFRSKGISANIQYRSSLGVIFACKKYADALWEVVKGRGINVHLRQHLVEIKTDTKEAVFENLDTNELETVPYDMIHITPPQSTPPSLHTNKDLVDAGGFLSVDKETLQHTKYPNIFGIGDCTSIPVARTAAAVAGQMGIMRKNLGAAISGSRSMPAIYPGYTSCPLVTGKSSLILAEFDYQVPPQPLETFPVNQAKERWTMFQLKSHLLPPLYWHGLVKGWWEGPGFIRKVLNLGFAK
eukprot:GFUD01009566.1.p1 GENE.GFUD01009566.1~~GFUD01009566.1.p1  ORF type:complete len:447 (+),score=127.42 GFUD01009566.1:93-1433(+)